MKLILLGGFLGSGKTTGIITACQILKARQKTVAVITNDQGDQQVDRAHVESLGIPSEEVSNGCFCCNYKQLDEHLQHLSTSRAPEFIFAEAVGSCTDMVATVVRPLKKFNPQLSVLFCVFVDAELLTTIFENRASFISESIRYIYKKQIEETEVLVVTKTDMVTASQVEKLNAILTAEYPTKRLLFQNSLDHDSIRSWMDFIESDQPAAAQPSLEIDYQIYGQGEAELAWVDKSIAIASTYNDAPFIVQVLIGQIFDQLQEQRLVIGHLKFFIESGSARQKISFTTTSTSSTATVSLPGASHVNVMINARVQTAPAKLVAVVDGALNSIQSRFNCQIEEGNTAAFAPGFPNPTYRMV